MAGFLGNFLVPIALAAVAFVLLQFVAIVIAMAALWALGR